MRGIFEKYKGIKYKLYPQKRGGKFELYIFWRDPFFMGDRVNGRFNKTQARLVAKVHINDYLEGKKK